MDEQVLVKYYTTVGRMGDMSGLYTCTRAEHEAIIGRTVHWGEVLGKHSEVSHVIKESHVTIVSTDQTLINEMIKAFGGGPGCTFCGYNPVTWIREYEADHADDE